MLVNISKVLNHIYYMTVLTSNYKIQDISLVKFWDYSIELLDKSNHNCYHIYLNISVVFQSCYSESMGEGWGGVEN